MKLVYSNNNVVLPFLIQDCTAIKIDKLVYHNVDQNVNSIMVSIDGWNNHIYFNGYSTEPYLFCISSIGPNTVISYDGSASLPDYSGGRGRSINQFNLSLKCDTTTSNTLQPLYGCTPENPVFLEISYFSNS